MRIWWPKRPVWTLSHSRQTLRRKNLEKPGNSGPCCWSRNQRRGRRVEREGTVVAQTRSTHSLHSIENCGENQWRVSIQLCRFSARPTPTAVCCSYTCTTIHPARTSNNWTLWHPVPPAFGTSKYLSEPSIGIFRLVTEYRSNATWSDHQHLQWVFEHVQYYSRRIFDALTRPTTSPPDESYNWRQLRGSYWPSSSVCPPTSMILNMTFPNLKTQLHPSQLLGPQAFHAEGTNGSNHRYTFNPNFVPSLRTWLML